MADYPDWTDEVQIVGTDIMVAIDLQGAYVMMPVDIQAQYLTLDINIAASAVTLNVNISSQTANINVDIKAQTLSNLNIQINAQAVGVYLQPDWQVKAGTDKNLNGSAAVGEATSTDVIDYTVPSGKTFYICQWGFFVYKDVGMVGILIYKHSGVYTTLVGSGGRPGNAHALTKPIAVVAGDHVVCRLWHYYAGTTTVVGSVGGYEI